MTGFCGAGLGLLLPFGAVSCESAPGVSATATYSGADLIGNHGGKISATKDLLTSVGARSFNDLDPQPEASRFLDKAHTGDVRILLIVFVAMLAAGFFAVAARSVLGRATFAAAFGAAALTVLIGAQIAARRAVVAWFAAQPGTFGPTETGHALPTGVTVHAGTGFWLSVSVLAAITVGNVVAILWHTRDRPPDDVLVPPGSVPAPA